MTEISDKQLESIRCGAVMGKRLGMNDTLKLIATIRTLRAENERLKAGLDVERAWRPIAAAPKDGRSILVWRSDWPNSISARWESVWNDWTLSGVLLRLGDWDTPTHYRELPLAPTNAGENDD